VGTEIDLEEWTEPATELNIWSSLKSGHSWLETKLQTLKFNYWNSHCKSYKITVKLHFYWNRDVLLFYLSAFRANVNFKLFKIIIGSFFFFKIGKICLFYFCLRDGLSCSKMWLEYSIVCSSSAAWLRSHVSDRGGSRLCLTGLSHWRT